MPFRVSRGRAWGPGTFDMKGGLVIALYAVDALAAAGFAPEKRIVFLWTSDEEIGSETSRVAIEREARRSDAVLVLEPALGLDGRVKTGRKGVGEIELIATGRAAHAGLNPEDGINAIEEMALQIGRIAQWNKPRRGITVNAGVIEGGTRTNVIADRARAVIDGARIAARQTCAPSKGNFAGFAQSSMAQRSKSAADLIALRWSGKQAWPSTKRRLQPVKRNGDRAGGSLRRRRVGRKFHGGAGSPNARWARRNRRRCAQPTSENIVAPRAA